MSCSGVYILDSKGKALISRNYRGDVETSDVDKFMTLVMEKEEEGITSPIIGERGRERSTGCRTVVFQRCVFRCFVRLVNDLF